MAHSQETATGPAIERGDDLPVGVNLSWRLRVLIQTGRLPATARLPGVREFAAGAGVNVNTARSVYRRLEDQGLMVSRQGSGTFVAPFVSVAPTLEEMAAETAADALAQGIDPRELARALYAGSSSGEPFGDPPGLDEAEPDAEDERRARAALRGQIARLEASLAPYPSGNPSERAAGPLGPQPRLSGLGELEQVRDELVEKLNRARSDAEQAGERDTVERRRFEAAVADPAGHRWEAGQLDELGEPGCGRWQVAPAWGPVGALMNWWRVKISRLPIAVQAFADRAFLPVKSLFEEVGDMMVLSAKTIVSAIRPPYPYGGEFIGQFLFALKLCWFPMTVSMVAICFGAPGLQAANFLSLFGALDRLGGFFVLASIREFAPVVTSVVVAGVAGTAITADLGARKIREELDALQVLGVDPIKNLVVPRFLALMLITGLLDVYAICFGISGGVIAEFMYNEPLGGFWATLFSNASVIDLWGSVLKTTCFGAIIAIVCSYKGMTASGGAEGVGRAVNEAVVIAFMGVFAFNYVFTQTLLATHPELQVIK